MCTQGTTRRDGDFNGLNVLPKPSTMISSSSPLSIEQRTIIVASPQASSFAAADAGACIYIRTPSLVPGHRLAPHPNSACHATRPARADPCS